MSEGKSDHLNYWCFYFLAVHHSYLIVNKLNRDKAVKNQLGEYRRAYFLCRKIALMSTLDRFYCLGYSSSLPLTSVKITNYFSANELPIKALLGNEYFAVLALK